MSRKLGPLTPEEARKELRAWRRVMLHMALTFIALLPLTAWLYTLTTFIMVAVVAGSFVAMLPYVYRLKRRELQRRTVSRSANRLDRIARDIGLPKPVGVKATGFDRRYRPPLAGLWYRVVFMAFVAVIFVALLIAVGAWVAVAVTVVATALVVVWLIRGFARKWGLHESAEAITSITVIGSVEVPWNRIDRFKTEGQQGRSRRRVRVFTKDGDKALLLGASQGRRVVWDGGETTDIVGVLNERLRDWRSTHGSSAGAAPD